MVEEDGEVRRLVRRRANWPGPRTRFEDVTPQDPVVLIEGKLDISFVFGRVTAGWRPRVVRQLGWRMGVAPLRAVDSAGPGHRRRSARRSRFRDTRQCSRSLRAIRRGCGLPVRRAFGAERRIRGGKASAYETQRSAPRRDLVTVLWSIALLSALAMAASVTFRGFAGVMAVERDRVQGDALLSAGLRDGCRHHRHVGRLPRFWMSKRRSTLPPVRYARASAMRVAASTLEKRPP